MAEPRLPRHDPKNDAGRQKRPLTADSRTLVDDISQELSDLRESYETRLKATDDEVSALRQTLEGANVQDALDKVIAMEERLAKLPTEGENNILDRLGDAEVALQRMDKRREEIPGVKSVRAQSMEILADECSRNPVWHQLIQNDPLVLQGDDGNSHRDTEEDDGGNDIVGQGMTRIRRDEEIQKIDLRRFGQQARAEERCALPLGKRERQEHDHGDGQRDGQQEKRRRVIREPSAFGRRKLPDVRNQGECDVRNLCGAPHKSP